MANTNITMRIDEELKSQLQDLMSNLGMDLTTFFTLAAKQAVREQSLPFKPSMGEQYNAETWQAKWEIEFMQAHPELPWITYDNVDTMFEEVLAEDEV